MELNICDRPGVMPKAELRRLFERAVNDTQALRETVSLEIIEKDGVFSHYKELETDTLWLGFALGVRGAERLGKAQIAICEYCHRPIEVCDEDMCKASVDGAAEKLIRKQTESASEPMPKDRVGAATWSAVTESNGDRIDAVSAEFALKLAEESEQLRETLGSFIAWDKEHPRGRVYNAGDPDNPDKALDRLLDAAREVLETSKSQLGQPYQPPKSSKI